jgi:hypothetical protein
VKKMAVRVTYRLKEENGHKFGIAGTGTTRAAAVAEANTKLALTVGEVISSTVSDVLAGGETGTAHDAGTYSDANLVLKQTATGKIVNIPLENISNEYGDGVTGDLLLDNADIVAFATAYRDGGGLGGYAPYGGSFVP